MKVFIDSNVWVAGFAGTGLCADLLDYVKQKHQALLSERVLQELEKGLRKQLRQIEPVIEAACREARAMSMIAEAPAKVVARCRDPKDDPILQAALDADGDWLVSGDADLSSLKRVQRMPITTPRDFLEAMGVEEPWI